MIFNNLFKRLFNKVTFTKVVIIFVVGLFSRVFINYFYGVNVFVEYTNLISLYYYGAMSLFAVFINEVVVYFEWDIFALLGNFIRYVLGFVRYFISIVFNFVSSIFFQHRYFTLGNVPEEKNIDIAKDVLKKKGYSIFAWKERNKTGWKSAGLAGLYGNNRGGPRTSAAVDGVYSSIVESTNVDTSDFNTSLLQKLKCQIYWYSWGQFKGNYSNYYDFKNSLDHNISIRQSVKNIFK